MPGSMLTRQVALWTIRACFYPQAVTNAWAWGHNRGALCSVTWAGCFLGEVLSKVVQER
jgi:hypothetical protein